MPATLALLLVVAWAAVGCRTATIIPPSPSPVHVVEITDEEPAPEIPITISESDPVVWLNATAESDVEIEVHGYFPPADEACLEGFFEPTDNGVATRTAVIPGDAVCLRFPVPGIYRYTVRRGDTTSEGQVKVSED